MPQAYIGQAYGEHYVSAVPQESASHHPRSNTLGSTEGTGVVSMTPAHEKHGRYGGILAPGIQGRVVKSDGQLAGYDEEGELHIRTPAVALGYLDNPSA